MDAGATSPTSPVTDAAPVVITDIRMRFWSMVWFMVKWAIAAIPAVVILVVIGFVIAGVLGVVVGLAPRALY